MTRQQPLPLIDADDALTCPSCGFTGDAVLDFDCMGACGDNVFCPCCHREIEPSGKRHRRAKCCVETYPIYDPKDGRVK